MNKDELFRILGINDHWLASGLLNLQELQKIESEYLASEEKRMYYSYGADHFRWFAFKDFLEINEFINMGTFVNLYNLAVNETDPQVSDSMLELLLQRSDCPAILIKRAYEQDSLMRENLRNLTKHRYETL